MMKISIVIPRTEIEGASKNGRNAKPYIFNRLYGIGKNDDF